MTGYAGRVRFLGRRASPSRSTATILAHSRRGMASRSSRAWGPGKLVYELYEKLVEDQLWVSDRSL